MSRLFRFDPMWQEHRLRDRYDVVVIGAGVHGLATAYYLARRGITNVAVLEKGYLGSGNSGRNTAILRANYRTPEAIPFYAESLALYEELSDDLDYTLLFSQQGHLTLAHTGPVTQVDLIVNGETVDTLAGLDGPGVRELAGSLNLPAGGWVAARAHGGAESWPGMNGSVFAQTSPVWIGEVGSHDPVAADAAARDLLRALDFSEAEVRERYGELPVPRILERFRLARERLRDFLR